MVCDDNDFAKNLLDDDDDADVYSICYLLSHRVAAPHACHLTYFFFLLIANSQAYPLSLPTFALMFSRRTANLKVFHWSNIMSSYS